jgi:hypothetical protein
MSFEITGMSYDASRKVNRMNKVMLQDTTVSPSVMKQQYSPVPYNIDISLYVLTKTQEDALQIVEQVLPFFTPEFTLKINAIPSMNTTLDIPIILNSVNIQDDYDGDFQTRRFVTYTINFTLKANFFGPISANGPITTVYIKDSQPGRKFSANGDFSTKTISETWNDAF